MKISPVCQAPHSKQTTRTLSHIGRILLSAMGRLKVFEFELSLSSPSPNHFTRILIFPDSKKDRLAETVIPPKFREFYLTQTEVMVLVILRLPQYCEARWVQSIMKLLIPLIFFGTVLSLSASGEPVITKYCVAKYGR